MALSIGDVARRTGLSVHTLRLYEKAGVLPGPVTRDLAGRRVYGDWDLAWLANCVLFRATGMPLATIARLAALVKAGPGNEEERLEILRAHQGTLGAQLAALQECQVLVTAKITAYEAHLKAGSPGDPWPPDAESREGAGNREE